MIIEMNNNKFHPNPEGVAGFYYWKKISPLLDLFDVGSFFSIILSVLRAFKLIK